MIACGTYVARVGQVPVMFQQSMSRTSDAGTGRAGSVLRVGSMRSSSTRALFYTPIV
jgi:hypothetical protein